jgi:hypothetical protein
MYNFVDDLFADGVKVTNDLLMSFFCTINWIHTDRMNMEIAFPSHHSKFSIPHFEGICVICKILLLSHTIISERNFNRLHFVLNLRVSFVFVQGSICYFDADSSFAA